MTDQPEFVEPAPQSEPEPDPVTADTVKRQWADELWYRRLPYRGRPS
jgi:hypothetical protein